MPEEDPATPPAVDETPAPPRPRGRAKAKTLPPKTEEASPPTENAAKEEAPRVPKRAPVGGDAMRLLALRRQFDRRRPIFGRQAANRYFRIGRDGAWRRPRGLQSKQRRHYGYRTQIVSVGYRSPARVRGLVPSGFRPIVVRTEAELDALDGHFHAAIIARNVGTRRRLVLEEAARRLGIKVLNPIEKAGSEE